MTESSPHAARRALGIARIRGLVDEGVALGLSDIFLTGGEPFLLPDIIEMLECVLDRARATVLTNAIPVQGELLDRLAAIACPELTVQVSLDGAKPGHNEKDYAVRSRRIIHIELGRGGRKPVDQVITRVLGVWCQWADGGSTEPARERGLFHHEDGPSNNC